MVVLLGTANENVLTGVTKFRSIPYFNVHKILYKVLVSFERLPGRERDVPPSPRRVIDLT